MWLTPKMAAKYACTSKSQVYKWSHQGLNYYKIGRKTLFDSTEINDFIRSHSKNKRVDSETMDAETMDAETISKRILSDLCLEK